MRKQSAVSAQNDRAGTTRMRGMYGSMHTDLYAADGLFELFPKRSRRLKPVSSTAGEGSENAVSKTSCKSISEKSAKPVRETPSKSISETSAKPVRETPSKSISETSAKPVRETPSKSVSETSAKPVHETSSKSISETPSKAVSEPLSKPASKPLSETSSKPAVSNGTGAEKKAVKKTGARVQNKQAGKKKKAAGRSAAGAGSGSNVPPVPGRQDNPCAGAGRVEKPAGAGAAAVVYRPVEPDRVLVRTVSPAAVQGTVGFPRTAVAVRAGARAAAVFPSNEIVKGRRIRIDADERTPLQSLRELLGGITLRTVLLVLAALTVISASVVLMTFNLKKAVIYGNTMYSEEQIESFLTKGRLGSNTFVMALKYHQRKVTDIPFVDRIDVDLVSPSTVRVNIREKPADGCVFYNGKNVYFSKEGIIQTVSGRSVEDAVKVNGVVLTHSNTESRILAKNQLGMDLSLELIRIMDKYGILKEADSIDVDEKSNLTVTFDKVRVRIGRNGYDEKMFKMHQILPYLEGRSGIIQMTGTEFTGENIVLSPDTPEAGKADSSPADGDE